MAKIVYKDVAVGADADAAYTAPGKTSFSTLNLSAGINSEPYITLEKNLWVLNGTKKALGSNSVAFWSTQLSDIDGEFSSPPVITITFDNLYSSQGITLNFDTATGDYCSDVDISWYQDAALKASGNFQPDSSVYFCEKQATAWNKIVITLNATSLPYRRAKLERVLFGVAREFTDEMLRSASAVNETNLISAELPDSQLNFVLDSQTAVDYLFQMKQPLEVYDGNNLIGVYYISTSSRKSTTLYNISARDAIGVLAEQTYNGSVHLSGVSAKTLVNTIVGGAFEVEYADGLADASLTGLLLKQDKRSALQQVLFAWGVACATDGGGKIKIFSPQSVSMEIGRDATYIGVSVTTEAIVTQVNVTAHTYTQSSTGTVEVNGQRYNDAKTVYTVDNPVVLATDKQNIKEVDGATLVSTANGQAVAQRVYDYYARRNRHSSKIRLNGERLGDCVEQPTPWETQEIGNIEYMKITLSHIVAADIQSLGVEE